MTTTRFLSQADLGKLTADLLAAKQRVVGPVRAADGAEAEYRALGIPEELALGGPLPRRSLKELFLPVTEVLLRWRRKKDDIELQEVPTKFEPTVVIGAVPCDAAAVETLDKLMNWDYRDELWFGRREATTIVALACPGRDASCFCTAIGLSPDATRGSDVLLVPTDGGFFAEAVTPKGEAFLAKHAARFGEPKGLEAARKLREAALARVAKNLTLVPDQIRGWLEGHFEHEVWSHIGLRCHGCGACASVCPTCHCFDIVDEPDGWETGVRRRNWDTCQTGRFTLHASGHNPRANQNVRFRQRLMHKFAIYPKRFGEILCTGCGRCARVCPGGMDLPEMLGKIAGLAAGTKAGGAR